LLNLLPNLHVVNGIFPKGLLDALHHDSVVRRGPGGEFRPGAIRKANLEWEGRGGVSGSVVGRSARRQLRAGAAGEANLR
jgi:hypothetical protein